MAARDFVPNNWQGIPSGFKWSFWGSPVPVGGAEAIRTLDPALFEPLLSLDNQLGFVSREVLGIREGGNGGTVREHRRRRVNRGKVQNKHREHSG